MDVQTRQIETLMPPEVTELVADVLIAIRARDTEHPSYCEESLSRKSRRATHAELYHAMLGASRPDEAEPSESAPQSTGLTRREAIALRMYVGGATPSEIARRLDIARPTVEGCLRSASRKLMSRTNGLPGLREVYLEEVNRRPYRKPSHCDEEACRRLGYCRYPGRLG